MQNIPEQVKLGGDAIAIASWASVLMGVATNFIGLLAAIASLAWGCIRIWETKTVQDWLERRKSAGQKG